MQLGAQCERAFARAVLPTILLLLFTAPSQAEELDPHRLELGVLPAISFDSDLGFGFGALGAAARYQPGSVPWRWRLEALLFLTVKRSPEGRAELPFTDDRISLDLPGLFDGALRLDFGAYFQRHRSRGWFGIGNASEVRRDAPPRFHQYDRISPSIEAIARVACGERLELLAGIRYTQSWIGLYEGSELQREARRLVGVGPHGQALGLLGVVYDSRDRELAPTRGQFHELSLRAGIGIGERFDYTGVGLTLRGWLPLFPPYLVLALRAIGDALSGEVPFYELARAGGISLQDITGGGGSIRGVVAQRFSGKVKVLANIELRGEAPYFELFEQRIHFGGLAFLDVGRVWSSFSPDAALDGDAFGLKLGLGGGLRLRWGETFLVRADVAWSPTTDGIGVYVDLGHLF